MTWFASSNNFMSRTEPFKIMNKLPDQNGNYSRI